MVEFGRRLTVFEHIMDVQALSDQVTKLRGQLKDNPNDPSLPDLITEAEMRLATATTRARADIHLVRSAEPEQPK